MYKSFLVNNFRGFKTLHFKDLDRLNLIAGKNSTGKTALLEALWLSSAAINPELVLSINGFRGLGKHALNRDPNADQPWDSIFYDFNRESEIQLKGFYQDNKKSTLKIRTERLESIEVDTEESRNFNTSGALIFEYESETSKETVRLWFERGQPKKSLALNTPFPSIYLASRRPVGPSEDAGRFGALAMGKEEEILIESLQCIEPRIKKMSVIPKADESVLHADIGSRRLIPLTLLGDGMVRLTTILLAIASAPNGVVLIDELENGLHYSVLPKIWNAIGKMADKFFTQVFATTHSLECIQAAHQAFKGSVAYEFRVHRIDRRNGEATIKTYDQDTLDAALQSGLEVR